MPNPTDRGPLARPRWLRSRVKDAAHGSEAIDRHASRDDGSQGHAAWEETASIEDVARIAEAADRLGYHHLTCSEHVALPAAELARRGSRYWDPLATFGYLAARTSRIRFTTLVLVLGYHHPLDIAKRYGTLDKVSNGRLILGVGVGRSERNSISLGAPFRTARCHGRRCPPCPPCVVVSTRSPRTTGSSTTSRASSSIPCAMQERVPLWVGGRSLRSLRRAATLADGWCPFAVAPAQAAEWLRPMDIPAGFEVVLPPTGRLDPIDEPVGRKRSSPKQQRMAPRSSRAVFATDRSRSTSTSSKRSPYCIPRRSALRRKSYRPSQLRHKI